MQPVRTSYSCVTQTLKAAPGPLRQLLGRIRRLLGVVPSLTKQSQWSGGVVCVFLAVAFLGGLWMWHGGPRAASKENLTSPPPTRYIVVWTLQGEDAVVAELLQGAKSVTDDGSRQAVILDGATLRERILKHLDSKADTAWLGAKMKWLRDPDEVMAEYPVYRGYPPEMFSLGVSSRSKPYEEPKHSGMWRIQGRFTLKSASDSTRFEVVADWHVSESHTVGEKHEWKTAAQEHLRLRADLQEGQVLVVSGLVPGLKASRQSGLVMFECVTVPHGHWREFFRMEDVQEWVRFGPQPVLEAVNRSAKWVQGVNGTVIQPSETWTQSLPNGARVTVLGLSRPNRWPYVWWNPDGEPIPFFRGAWKTSPVSDDKLVAFVRILRDPLVGQDLAPIDLKWFRDLSDYDGRRIETLWKKKPRGGGPDGEFLFVEVDPQSATPLRMPVGNGDWTALGELQADQPYWLDEGSCRVRIRIQSSEFVNTDFIYPTIAGRELSLVAVKISGERVETISPQSDSPGWNGDGWIKFPQFHMPSADLSHFELLIRPIEEAQFQGFFTEPESPVLGKGRRPVSDQPTEALPKTDE